MHNLKSNGLNFPAKRAVARLLSISLSLIPALNGLLIFFNNVFTWREVTQRITIPLLSMAGTDKHPAYFWRAIETEAIAIACHFFVLALPLMIGLISLLGIGSMVKGFRADRGLFLSGMCWVKWACLLGLFLWGFLFTTIAGSWFLSWQNPDLSFLHLDGLLYSAIVMFVYFSLDSLAKEI